MKKKKATKLVLTMIVLLALIGGYVALVLFQPKEEKEHTEEEKERFSIVSIESDTISKITYTKDDEEIVLVRKGEGWITPNDEKCPVDKYTVNNMATAISDIEATRKIEEKDIDTKAFGFDEPSKVITYIGEDGKEVTYTLGIINEVSDKYYFRMSGDPNAYLIDSTLYNSLDYDLLGLAEVEDYPSLSESNIYEVSICREGKQLYYVDSADAAHKMLEDEIPECVWMKGRERDKLSAADKEEAGELMNTIISLQNAECVAYDKTDKDMKKYGLREPAMTLTVKYTYKQDTEEGENAKVKEGEYTVFFGDKEKESGEYYVYMDGSDRIYTMNVSNVETLLETMK